MKKIFLKRILGLFILAAVSLSCASDLDFEQARDLTLEPVVVANMVNFDIPESQFVIAGTGPLFIEDTSIVDVFKGSFLNENVTKVDMFFEFNNTINRAYTINIELLNGNGVRLDTMTFPVPAYAGGNSVIVFPPEIFENARLNLLKNTTKMKFTINMSPGPALSMSSLGSLKLRSGATVYFVI